MQFTLLEIAIPLPLLGPRHAEKSDTVTIERSVVCEVPAYRGVMTADALRYEHFLWMMGELEAEEPVGLPFPWAGLLFIKGALGRGFGQLKMLEANGGRKAGSYTELYEVQIALDESARLSAVRRIYRHLPDSVPLVVVLRNSEIAMQGEQHFFERNKLPLLAAAITAMESQKVSTVRSRERGAQCWQPWAGGKPALSIAESAG